MPTSPILATDKSLCAPVNDCGKWLNNVGNGERYDGTYRNPGNGEATFNYTGSCDEWTVSRATRPPSRASCDRTVSRVDC